MALAGECMKEVEKRGPAINFACYIGAANPAYIDTAHPQSASLDRGDDPIVRSVMGLMLAAGGIVLPFGWAWRRCRIAALR